MQIHTDKFPQRSFVAKCHKPHPAPASPSLRALCAIMKQNYIHFLLSLLLLFNCGYAADGNTWIEVKGGVWVPSPEVLTFVKSGTKDAIESFAQQHDRQLRSWDSYTFQYQGMSRNNRKFVFVNALCKESSFGKTVKLNRNFLVVKDGGSCYFQLKYDPALGKFYEVFINGEA